MTVEQFITVGREFGPYIAFILSLFGLGWWKLSVDRADARQRAKDEIARHAADAAAAKEREDKAFELTKELMRQNAEREDRIMVFSNRQAAVLQEISDSVKAFTHFHCRLEDRISAHESNTSVHFQDGPCLRRIRTASVRRKKCSQGEL